MAGFRHCRFCQGAGCLACPKEAKRYQAEEAKREARFNALPRDQQVKELEFSHKILSAFADSVHASDEQKADVLRDVNNRMAVIAVREVTEAAQDVADAEACERSFKNGITFRKDNPDDLALCKALFGPKALEEIFKDGDTPEARAELDRRFYETKLIQAARQVLCPNADDLAELYEPAPAAPVPPTRPIVKKVRKGKTR